MINRLELNQREQRAKVAPDHALQMCDVQKIYLLYEQFGNCATKFK